MAVKVAVFIVSQKVEKGQWVGKDRPAEAGGADKFGGGADGTTWKIM